MVEGGHSVQSWKNLSLPNSWIVDDSFTLQTCSDLVQPFSSLAKYDQMKKLISAFYRTDTESRDVMDPEPGRFLQGSISIVITRPVLGMLVAVKINKEWFRAEVLFKLGNMSNTMVGTDFLVKLVDIGKVEVVNIRSMRILEKCFPTLPVQVGTFLPSQCPH